MERVAVKDFEKISKNKEIVKDGMMVNEDNLYDYCEKHFLDVYDIMNLFESFGYDFY